MANGQDYNEVQQGDMNAQGYGAWAEVKRDESQYYTQENEAENAENEALRKRHRAEATGAHADAAGLSFADLPLDPILLERLDRLGYKKPFEIQMKTLHHTLKGCDIIGRAVTGSGKTLAFSIPIVQKLLLSYQAGQQASQHPRAIVIAPTRELANQIFRSIQELHPSVRCVALYGGDSMARQEQALQRGVDVVCATPGRLNDHIERGNLSVHEVEFLCLDEADELLTPNFKEQIEDVLQNSPQEKQMLLFSATMAPEIRTLAQRYMRDPVYVDLTDGERPTTAASVEHLCMEALPNRALRTVEAVIRQYQPERTIVFLKTKVLCNKTAQFLEIAGLSAQALHSDLSQLRREKILQRFRFGTLKVLCATDVAARGLDIPEVELVIQAEPPANGTEYYVHRSGRTGRAGRKGTAILIHSGSNSDKWAIYQIEKLVTLQHVPPPDTTGGLADSDFHPSTNYNEDGWDSGSRWQQKRPFNRQRNDFRGRGRNNYTKDYQQNNYRSNYQRGGYAQKQGYGQKSYGGQTQGYGQNPSYNQNQSYGQNSYGQNHTYGQNSTYQKPSYGGTQANSYGVQKRNDGWYPKNSESRGGGNQLRPRRKRFFNETGNAD